MGEDAVNALRIIARRSHLPWEPEDPSSQGVRRDFARVPMIPAELVSIILEHYYRTFSPNASPSAMDWKFLKSYAGAPDEPIHRNFNLSRSSTNPMDAAALPGSLLLATQDDTLIYGFGWNHQVAFESNKTEIHLRKGDLLIFRGDFIHARAGYSWNNLCIHAFLGRAPTCFRAPGPLIPQYDDKPQVNANDIRCYVWHCGFEGRSKRSLSNHISGHHNFVARRSSSTSPNYDPHRAANEAEMADSNWPSDNGSSVACTVIVNYARFVVQNQPSHNQLSSAPVELETDSSDAVMEVLVATDTDSETEAVANVGGERISCFDRALSRRVPPR
ncbi:hypothetical protein PR003_g13464 [Phytophthora rubi]|uniref:Uncharacterized protein n=1 Tax=Phytophthora rubi TaxID=129364 RepID=A0A6A4F261_9STRA|nr:hypothetical protein PR003_g13464 [Phytophthora rubi]